MKTRKFFKYFFIAHMWTYFLATWISNSFIIPIRDKADWILFGTFEFFVIYFCFLITFDDDNN